MKRNIKAFTMVEILVVIAILAILSATLIPAVVKARTKASVHKAQAEMANFASIGSIIKLDIGYYARLRDYDDTSATTVYVFTLADATTTALYSGQSGYSASKWDGPYTTFQSEWVDASGNPKDPWGNAYQLEYNTTEKVMVLYSNGPNENDEILTAGSTTVLGDDILYKFK